jgi:YbbR domain-containing protein
MLHWLWDNLSTLVLSLVLAVSVWIAAVNADDPTEVRPLATPVPIEYVNLPQGMMLVGEAPAEGSVVVRAPRSVWDRLTPEDIHLSVDLAGLSGGPHQLVVVPFIDVQPAQVASFEPTGVRVMLEQSLTRDVPISIDVIGEPALGFRASTPSVTPVEASVSGPASIIDTVAELRARVDITGLRETLDNELSLIPVTADGQRVTGVTVQPEQAMVQVRITQRGGFREVAVRVVVEGLVEAGYYLTNVTVTPPIVTVFSSDPSAVESLPGFVETVPLQLAGAKQDIERRLALNLPAGVSLVGDQDVLVQVSIAAIQESRTITLDVEAQGLGPSLFAEPSPDTIVVIVTGPLTTLETLGPDTLRAILDLLDLGPGTHQVAPQVVGLPSDVTVQTILPSTIEVVISTTPIPTPSLTPAPPPGT